MNTSPTASDCGMYETTDYLGVGGGGGRGFRDNLSFYRFLLGPGNVSLRTLHQQGISEPEFYGNLVYKIRKIIGKSNF